MGGIHRCNPNESQCKIVGLFILLKELKLELISIL